MLSGVYDFVILLTESEDSFVNPLRNLGTVEDTCHFLSPTPLNQLFCGLIRLVHDPGANVVHDLEAMHGPKRQFQETPSARYRCSGQILDFESEVLEYPV
jgi:hypothetical protein